MVAMANSMALSFKLFFLELYFKSINSVAPDYPLGCLHPHTPVRALRSTNQLPLDIIDPDI